MTTCQLFVLKWLDKASILCRFSCLCRQVGETLTFLWIIFMIENFADIYFLFSISGLQPSVFKVVDSYETHSEMDFLLQFRCVSTLWRIYQLKTVKGLPSQILVKLTHWRNSFHKTPLCCSKTHDYTKKICMNLHLIFLYNESIQHQKYVLRKAVTWRYPVKSY